MTEKQIIDAEKGFICRTFYTRGGQKLYKSFVDAKSYGIDETWFTDPFCKVIWISGERLFAHADFKDITLLSVIQETTKVIAESKDSSIKNVKIEISTFEEFEKVVSPDDDIATYVKIIQDATMIRAAKEQMNKFAEAVASGDDVTQALSVLSNATQNVLQTKNPSHRVSISSLCEKALQDWDEAHHQIYELGNYEWTPGIPLPWRKMSYALNGFTPDITILAARPGVGKTSFALNFCRYWLDIGLHVMFVSVDMSPIGFIKRQLSERTRISARQLQFGKSNFYEKDREKVVREIETLKSLEDSGRFFLSDEHDIDNIKATCAILKDQGKLDVLIVDYLQLLNFKGAAKLSTTAKTTYISNTLHEIANSMQIPILCLSQLNRDNTKDGGREPQVSDLRDSGAIEQDAANVLLLHKYESLYNDWRGSEPPIQYAKDPAHTDSLKAISPVWCILGKVREGDAGTHIPFVVFNNKYAWYQGDWRAENDKDKFAKICDDWRHDDIEKICEANGALIKMNDVRAIEITNLNVQRRNLGLPLLQIPGEQQNFSKYSTDFSDGSGYDNNSAGDF